jgi:hypothetical protein
MRAAFLVALTRSEQTVGQLACSIIGASDMSLNLRRIPSNVRTQFVGIRNLLDGEQAYHSVPHRIFDRTYPAHQNTKP